jgi:hypothetical protein
MGMANIPQAGDTGVALLPLLRGEHRSADPTDQTTNLRHWEETRGKEAPLVPGVCFYVCRDHAWFQPSGPYARRLCTSPLDHISGTFDTDVPRRTAYRRRRNSCKPSLPACVSHV